MCHRNSVNTSLLEKTCYIERDEQEAKATLCDCNPGRLFRLSCQAIPGAKIEARLSPNYEPYEPGGNHSPTNR